MSGGYFNYKNYHIDNIADSLQSIVDNNDSIEKNEWDEDIGRHYPPEVIDIFKETVTQLREVSKKVHHIDYLLEGDTGVETFLKRINETKKDSE